jgi:mono/diheme cytochrome c family protein
MPSFAHTLSDEQVAAVVNYLQSGLGENSYEPAATVEQVELSRPHNLNTE